MSPAESVRFIRERARAVERMFKSGKSGSDGECVETAFLDGEVAVRDSKDRVGAVLRFPGDSWTRFLVGAKSGEFNGS